MGSLRTELNKLRREIANTPADGSGGKWVLSWTTHMNEVEQAEWNAYIAWVERTYPRRDIEAELAAMRTINPTVDDP